MTRPLDELKIRARLLQKALAAGEPRARQRAETVARKHRWALPVQWTLGQCLNVVAAETGFAHWAHARRVLSGEAQPGEDMGQLWYDTRCAALLNQWFPSYGEARACLRAETGRFLLPYARQFIVVEESFIAALGMDAAASAWREAGGDLVAAYGSVAWARLLQVRLQAMREG